MWLLLMGWILGYIGKWENGGWNWGGYGREGKHSFYKIHIEGYITKILSMDKIVRVSSRSDCDSSGLPRLN